MRLASCYLILQSYKKFSGGGKFKNKKKSKFHFIQITLTSIYILQSAFINREIAIYAKNIYFRTKKPNNNSIIMKRKLIFFKTHRFRPSLHQHRNSKRQHSPLHLQRRNRTKNKPCRKLLQLGSMDLRITRNFPRSLRT